MSSRQRCNSAKNFASSGSSKPITTTITVAIRIFDKFMQREKIILINGVTGWWGSTMIHYHGRLMVCLQSCSSRCISFAMKHSNRVAMDKTSLDIWLCNDLASINARSCSEKHKKCISDSHSKHASERWQQTSSLVSMKDGASLDTLYIHYVLFMMVITL